MADHKNNSYGFEVPGKQGGNMPEQQIVSPEVKAAETGQGMDVSKYTLFWLLQHYNKENKALYGMHKEWKKSVKEKKKEEKKSGVKQNGSMSSAQAEFPGEMRGATAPLPQVNVQKEPERQVEINDDNYGATVFVNREQMTIKPKSAELECLGFDATVPVTKLPFRIGRSRSGIDLCIADNDTVSRLHAEITASNGIYYIKDMDSVNHVYLNDMQIPSGKNVQLDDGARFSLGTEQFLFRISK